MENILGIEDAVSCRWCNAALDDPVQVAGEFVDVAIAKTPEAGAVSICWYCGTLSVFTDAELNKRRPKWSELLVICMDQEFLTTWRMNETLSNQRPK